MFVHYLWITPRHKFGAFLRVQQHRQRRRRHSLEQFGTIGTELFTLPLCSMVVSSSSITERQLCVCVFLWNVVFDCWSCCCWWTVLLPFAALLLLHICHTADFVAVLFWYLLALQFWTFWNWRLQQKQKVPENSSVQGFCYVAHFVILRKTLYLQLIIEPFCTEGTKKNSEHCSEWGACLLQIICSSGPSMLTFKFF